MHNYAVNIYILTSVTYVCIMWKILLLFISSDPSLFLPISHYLILFPPISHCLIFTANLLTPPIYFHGFASILYKPLYCPWFGSIILDSKPFGSNKGYHSCSPLPSVPYNFFFKYEWLAWRSNTSVQRWITYAHTAPVSNCQIHAYIREIGTHGVRFQPK
jgi:hypothetical protein